MGWKVFTFCALIDVRLSCPMIHCSIETFFYSIFNSFYCIFFVLFCLATVEKSECASFEFRTAFTSGIVGIKHSRGFQKHSIIVFIVRFGCDGRLLCTELLQGRSRRSRRKRIFQQPILISYPMWTKAKQFYKLVTLKVGKLDQFFNHFQKSLLKSMNYQMGRVGFIPKTWISSGWTCPGKK